MSKISTYQNEIYYDFLSIEERSFNEKIRFVERNWEGIEELGSEVKVEIFSDYLNALRELEKHHAILPLAQGLLELIIEENIVLINDEDIFRKILFRKAEAHLALYQNDKAGHSLKELIKMDSSNKEYQKLTLQLRKQERQDITQKVLATCIALFLFSAAIIAFELLFVRVFYDEYTGIVELLRNLSLLSGILIYAVYNLKNYIKDIKFLSQRI